MHSMFTETNIMNLFQFPLIKIAIWFIAGILFASQITVPIIPIYYILAICLLSGTIILKQNKNHIQKVIFGIMVYGLAFLIGITTQNSHNDTADKDHFSKRLKDETQNLHITLRERLKPTLYADRYVAIVNQIDNQPIHGKVLVNFSLDSANKKFHIGSQLHVQAKIERHKPPLNPNQFDYGNYLSNKAIAAQIYTTVSEVKINPNAICDIWFYADRFRTNIISNLKGAIGTKELAVLNALILGQQQDIDPEILKDFQFAGAVHILSVSGLHVGFLLMFLNLLLKRLPNHSSGRTIKFLIIVFFLWSFAILAGLSPSVVRSVTMFSFVALGMCISRSTNIFHTLVISIVIILLFKPSFLFDVGFQLSYVALFFILWLQPALSKFWQPENVVIKYFWDIVTVSVAAQVGALPLSIYYFHQFPGLFFITNVLIIPFITVIMGLGLLVMMMAAFNLVYPLTSKLLESCIYAMNEIIHYVASFESFIIQDIPMNKYVLIGFYLVIISVVFWYKNPSYHKLIVVGCTFITVQSTYFFTLYDIRKTSELLVYHVKQQTLITQRSGQVVNAYLSKSDAKVENTIKVYTTAQFCQLSKRQPLRNTMIFGERKLLIIDSSAVYQISERPDVILLTQSPKFNLERMLKTVQPTVVIADGSNYKSYAARWQQTCRKQKIPFHFTGEKGFFRIIK